MDNKKLVETVAANLGRSDEDVSKLLEALAGVLRTRDGTAQHGQAHAGAAQGGGGL